MLATSNPLPVATQKLPAFRARRATAVQVHASMAGVRSTDFAASKVMTVQMPCFGGDEVRS